jgi:hypothetical protein
MDDAGRVDLQHDPYCLRKHFTTRWGIPKGAEAFGAPQEGYTLDWDDSEWFLKAEGKHAGLQVDSSQLSTLRYENDRRMALKDLITSHLLLYRITVNFAAPPST